MTLFFKSFIAYLAHEWFLVGVSEPMPLEVAASPERTVANLASVRFLVVVHQMMVVEVASAAERLVA